LFRLQKSTSGAWHGAPGRDERTEAALSSPSSFGSGGRKSVGRRTEAAKPRDRWRVRVRGRFAQARLVERALVDGRRLGPLEAPTLNGSAGKAVLAVRAALRRTRIATWRQRSRGSARPRKTTPRSGGVTCGLDIDREPGRIGWHPCPPHRRARANASRLKLVTCRQTRRDPGRPLGLVSIGRGESRESGWPPRGSMNPSGARVVSRLQKSVRSIFPAPSAGAARRSGRAG
jgi:hypothetical protein